MERTWRVFTINQKNGEVLDTEETDIDSYGLIVVKLRSLAGMGARISNKEKQKQNPRPYVATLFEALNG